MEELNLDEIKDLLNEMGLHYKEENAPEPEQNLIRSFGYRPFPLVVDVSALENMDASRGTLVQNQDLSVDNGVYVFALLHSGQAGFLVVKPGTVSRAPLIRQAAGDVLTAVSGLNIPPLLPFDMMEVAGHVLVNTCIKSIMEACGVEKQYESLFVKLYLPKFLINVAMYMTGAVNEDGSPMIYEATANIEPMAIWQGIQKGVINVETEDKAAAGDGSVKKEEKEKETPVT